MADEEVTGVTTDEGVLLLDEEEMAEEEVVEDEEQELEVLVHTGTEIVQGQSVMVRVVAEVTV